MRAGGTVSTGLQIGRRSRMMIAAALIGLVLSIVAPVFSNSAQVSAEWSPPNTVYIPETGQSIDGFFLDTWRAWGGAASLGNPITSEFKQDGRIVQYYEFSRLEYWPDDPNGEVVKFGEIGRELKPVSVFRTMPSLPGMTDTRPVSQELAMELRAWLPLDGETFARPESADWTYVEETGHSVQFGFKSWWESTGGPDYLGNPLTEEYILGDTTYQVFEHGQLAWKSDAGVWLVPVGEILVKRYQLDTTPRGQGALPVYSEDLWIPPPPPEPEPQIAAPAGEKWIQVNLSSQYMVAWQGGVAVMESYVSTGRPGFDTPTGTFSVIYHNPLEDMEGVLGGEYYNVPEVPWVMYFTSVGHAIHGAYWHNNFGAVMSHGCVNLPLGVAEFLYNWAEPGTRIEISY